MGQCLITRKGGIKPKLKTLGTLTRTSGWWGSATLTLTFNVKNAYSKYNKLTIDDFVIAFKSISSAENRDTLTLSSKSYNASTGVLTIVLNSQYNNGGNYEIPIVILDRYGL